MAMDGTKAKCPGSPRFLDWLAKHNRAQSHLGRFEPRNELGQPTRRAARGGLRLFGRRRGGAERLMVKGAREEWNQ